MVMQSSQLTIPGTLLPMITEHASKSVVAQLSPDKPTLFGPVSAGHFAGTAKAQIVGEGEAKGSQDLSVSSMRAEPIKAQITVRVTDEWRWADADWRLGMMQDVIVPAIGTGMSRAVDLIVLHGVNPIDGKPTTKMANPIIATKNSTTMADTPTGPDEAIRLAAGMVIGNGGTPTGLAADSTFGFAVANERDAQGNLKYPALGFGQNIQNFMGLTMASGSTVSGQPELGADSKLRAVVGDWSALRWGYQRQIPLHTIEFGDPDNSGRDLQGHNEVAIRAEFVLYALNTAPERFATIKAA